MLFATQSPRGMVVAPHHLASEAGLSALRDGANAVEAMVAAAATIAVVYPHMNALGGDGFWIIHEPGREPIAIDACGATGANVTESLYRDAGLGAIPSRGALAANTVAGTVSGWDAALRVASGWGPKSMPLERLLEDAIFYAEHGVGVTDSLASNLQAKRPELTSVPGFREAFLPDGLPTINARFQQPRLGATLRTLSTDGLESFYRGRLAEQIGADLARAGSPITTRDLNAHHASKREPLSVRIAGSRLINFPPPTQGLASLLILAIYDQLHQADIAEPHFIHRVVEATKQAFLVRDRFITDPQYMDQSAESFLRAEHIATLVDAIDLDTARPWPRPSEPGDTVWLGAIDREGRAVSFIQSIYWEFGSGVVLDETGLLWQNRGSSFQLAPQSSQPLMPGRKPFHTLNPALAQFDDGRVMTYGTMGGEGQPQTQATLFARYAHCGEDLQRAISEPRWLLGRTWGAESTTLKLESRFAPETVRTLRAMGHDVELVEAYDSVVGHAGAIVRHPDGRLEGAADPRADARAAGY